MTSGGPVAERVLIHARAGRDADLTCRVLEGEGLHCHVCPSVGVLDEEIARGAGLAVVGQESLDPPVVARLVSRLEDQPVWSDLPVLVLTRESNSGEEVVRALGPTVNVTILERPVRITTMVSAVLAALRARRRQYEVRDLVHRLAESDRHKDEFLAMLGHELRNPLSAIATATTILDLECGDAEPLVRQVALVRRQVAHLSRLVDDLLDLSRLSLGKITLQEEPVELRRVTEGAVETLEMAGRNGKHEVSVRLPSEELFVVGDSIRLEQVVANLLQNAVKYTPEGGHVDLTVERRGEEAMIRVRDDGMGIAAEDVDGIFEPFTQLEGKASASPGGLGVGLYLTRRLVALHHGRIEVSSEGLGKGSEFAVALPVASGVRAAGTADGAEQARARRERSERPRPGSLDCRVLLVEDNAEGREALEELLRIWGCQVTAVATGAAAVEEAVGAPPDLSLVDIGLPDMDGYEVARRIRDELGVRCGCLVALTGFGQPEDRRRALDAGFDEHLVKPVDPGRLATILGDLLTSTE